MSHPKSIGIIGAGAIGSAFARALARAHIHATIANSRGPATLRELVHELSPWLSAGTREEAAARDMVLVAVNWSKLPAALAELPAWNGRIVIDANNAIERPRYEGLDLGGKSSSEVLRELVPGARVVKAFNHLQAPLLVSDPSAEGGRRVLFFSGDEDDAKAEVAALIQQLGFFGIDLGRLAAGGRLAEFPGGALTLHNLARFG